jgi:hypothetical protein
MQILEIFLPMEVPFSYFPILGQLQNLENLLIKLTGPACMNSTGLRPLPTGILVGPRLTQPSDRARFQHHALGFVPPEQAGRYTAFLRPGTAHSFAPHVLSPWFQRHPYPLPCASK